MGLAMTMRGFGLVSGIPDNFESAGPSFEPSPVVVAILTYSTALTSSCHEDVDIH